MGDHESYIIAGSGITHTIIAGLGLEINSILMCQEIGEGKTANVARHVLRLFTNVLEANTETSKFIQCLSLLEFIAFPDDFQKIQKVKTEIAAHVAATKSEYYQICKEFKNFTSLMDNSRDVGTPRFRASMIWLATQINKSASQIVAMPYSGTVSTLIVTP